MRLLALHFYLNGSTGNRDGTLLSSGDWSNPLVFDGLYPGAASVFKTLTIHIRADMGETWRAVNLQFKGTNNARFKFTGGVSYFQTTGFYDPGYGATAFFLKIQDINFAVPIKVEATPKDTNSPDTSVQLVAWGVQC